MVVVVLPEVEDHLVAAEEHREVEDLLEVPLVEAVGEPLEVVVEVSLVDEVLLEALLADVAGSSQLYWLTWDVSFQGMVQALVENTRPQKNGQDGMSE